MSSTRRPRPVTARRLSILALALAFALVGCQNDAREAASDAPVASEAAEGPLALADGTPIDPEDAELVRELAESRRQAREKMEPVDPEIAKRMQDPEYRKQKDDMLNRLSQVSNAYFKQGIEIRHTRKRPEWRLIDKRLAAIADPNERRQKGEELAMNFKREIEPVLEKPIDVIVFADASESIQVF